MPGLGRPGVSGCVALGVTRRGAGRGGARGATGGLVGLPTSGQGVQTLLTPKLQVRTAFVWSATVCTVN